MVNVSSLKKGDFIKVIVENLNMGLNVGDILQIIDLGFSRWDDMKWVEGKSKNGATIEIMKNYKNFENL
jgi:hypothetical protein